MTSGRPEPSGDEAWRQPRVDNQLTGDAHGPVFQAGQFDGDIHIHYHGGLASTPPALPSPAPPSAPPPSYQPRPSFTPAVSAGIPFAMPAKPRRRWPRVVGEWLLSFAPIFAVSLAPGFITLGIVGDDTVGARLAGLAIGLAFVAVIGLVWWLVTRSRSQLSAGAFVLWALDRLAFQRLGTVGTGGLIVIIVMFGGAMLTGLGQQPQPSSTGGVQHPAAAIVFCALVVLVAARRLKQG